MRAAAALVLAALLSAPAARAQDSGFLVAARATPAFMAGAPKLPATAFGFMEYQVKAGLAMKFSLTREEEEKTGRELYRLYHFLQFTEMAEKKKGVMDVEQYILFRPDLYLLKLTHEQKVVAGMYRFQVKTTMESHQGNFVIKYSKDSMGRKTEDTVTLNAQTATVYFPVPDVIGFVFAIYCARNDFPKHATRLGLYHLDEGGMQRKTVYRKLGTQSMTFEGKEVPVQVVEQVRTDSPDVSPTLFHVSEKGVVLKMSKKELGDALLSKFTSPGGK